MLIDWMQSPWFWWGAALALLAAEALLPGAFLLWLGFAALATAALLLLLPALSLPAQWVLFAVLGLVAVAVGWRLRRRNPPADSDHPLLNRRGEQLIGRVFVLDTAIVNGRGRLKVGDAFWTTTGPELPAGTRVRVVSLQGMLLTVEPADAPAP